ncbi:TPA: hypothetical protein I7264_07215 [Vibrio parahaemolyticus]|uniref:hypothetical protein n=1 Tax=Vibrio parahaemolyticus TaxID=670 RepID=UPI0004A4F7FA|nr:hypothetical protein [Vibrio parahaemolyticus]EGQ8494628.1 hypothetical protein [Vibrio alginolyticus]AWG84098.1 hypothetical protein Vp2S01_1758 [Vibrio parahaemolyticus]EGQ9862020.1 hypothetical protein [Vibrio parahaemolyticus]EGR1393709.1 hypothetical protein [Vibrio parahaemolyticus]EGR3032194.1 hypothetical protein [Vibrio parahaemolyticus]
MKRILFALLIPFFANAGVSQNDKSVDESNLVVSLRYADTTMMGKNNDLFGFSFATGLKEEGFGYALSFDSQSFDINGRNTDIGVENTKYDYKNVMFGTTYGVTDNFYLIPKLGLTFNRYKSKYKGVTHIPNTGMAYPAMKYKSEHDYSMSYGLDMMFFSKRVAYGFGITDSDYFGNRETKANISIGYAF